MPGNEVCLLPIPKKMGLIQRRLTKSVIFYSLGWAELFYAMGNIFRRFEFSVHPETDVTDVEYKHDFFNSRVKLTSKGVKMMVREVAA